MIWSMRHTHCQWTVALVLMTNAVHITCFVPSLTTNIPSDTYSHVQITRDGVQRAAAKFLTDNGIVVTSYQGAERVLHKYFGQDIDSQERFNKRIEDLSMRMNKVQLDFKDIAKYTVNGERIEDAFNLLNKLSAQTRAMISFDPFDTGAQESTLDNLTKALLIIQSFYSNTNWVEMNGDAHCPAFGEGGDIPKTVLPREGTCRDCDPNNKYNCVSNILTNVLTSGYKPDQDIKIPQLVNGLKCAHGWNTDNNGLAIGGINKDTTDSLISPHADFHPEAAVAAIRATAAYLYQNGKGVLSKVSVDNFKTLLWLNSLKNQSRGSMTFVLDISGSMADDIAVVRDVCINMISAIQGTPNEPADYVLTTFSDPENLTTGERYINGNDMISKLQSLTADGGGECPEYAISGILKAISLSKPGSKLYVFTDADAEDSGGMKEVNDRAKTKRISVTFLLTGTCSRRRRAAGRIARAVDDVYIQIAEVTGGQIYQTNKSGLFSILSTIIRDDMPSSDALIHSFTMSPTTSDRKVVVVDSTINLVKIDVVGPTAIDDITVKNPTGSTLQFRAGVATRYFSKRKIIISVQKPMPGNWTIIRSKARILSVNATGSSPFDFTYQLLEEDERKNSYIIQGNPMAGYNYTLSSQIIHLDNNATMVFISFVNLLGNEVARFQTFFRRIGSAMFAVVDVTMPSERVRVQLTGILPDGEHFQRTNPQVISPVNVKLRLRTILDPIPFNEPQNITFELGNCGPDNQTFVVDIETDLGSLPSMSYTMGHGEFNEYNFQVKGHPPFPTLKYTVSVRESSSDVVIQSLSSTVWFENPACEIIFIEGTCPEAVKAPASCEHIMWFSQVVLSAEVTSHKITTAKTSNITIMMYDTTFDGEIYLNVRKNYVNICFDSGDCCSPSVYMSTLGVDGQINGQCHFNFGSVPTITITETSEFATDWTLFLCIFGAAAAHFVILVTVVVWYRRRTRQCIIDNSVESDGK